jgi:hypothetical protein
MSPRINLPKLHLRKPINDTTKPSPAGDSSASSTPGQIRQSRIGTVNGALDRLKSKAESGGERLTAGVQAGTQRLRVGADKLKELMAAKVNEKFAEQLTPDKIASATLKASKIIAQSAPALAAGPAGVPAFAKALMANGGEKIANDLKNKVQQELLNPEAQKKMLIGGANMVKQAFAKPSDT